METTKPTLAAAQPDAARATLFRNVYLWMTMALALTALTAYTVAGSETLLQAIFSSRFVFLGLIVAELVLVFVLAANIMRMSFLTATLMFIAYSVVNGATLSTIFLVYDLGSIGLTFLVTAGMFGAMSLLRLRHGARPLVVGQPADDGPRGRDPRLGGQSLPPKRDAHVDRHLRRHPALRRADGLRHADDQADDLLRRRGRRADAENGAAGCAVALPRFHQPVSGCGIWNKSK